MFARALLIAAVVVAALALDATAAPFCHDYGETFHYVAGLPVPEVTYDGMGYSCLIVKGRKGYAYQGGKGLRVFDLLDPAAPVHRGIVQLGVYVYDLAAIDHYVLAVSGQLRVVDVDDHDHPTLVSTVDTPGTARGVVILARTAYVADAATGVTLYDIDNPELPVLIGSVATTASARSVHYYNGLLLVGCAGALDLFDLTVPTAPVLLGTLSDIPGTVTEIAARGDVALIEHDWDARLVDISDPTAPVVLAADFATNSVTAVAVTDDVAWLGGDRGWEGGSLDRFAISDPTAPVRIGRTITHGWPNGLVFALDHLFAANAGDYLDGAETEGFHVYDPTYPASPPQVGFVDLTSYWFNWGTSVLRGQYLYVCGDGAVGTVDLSQPTNPHQRGSQSTGDYSRQAVVVNDHLVVWLWDFPSVEYLQAFDISNPDAMPLRGTLVQGGGLTSHGGLLYQSRDDGIHVIEVDGSGNLTVQQVIRPDDPVGSLVAVGSRAVGMGADGWLRVMEFEDPFTLVDVGSLAPVPGRTRRPWAISHDLVFVQHNRPSAEWPWNGAWEIIDISDPTVPVVLCEVAMPFEEHLGELTFIAGRLFVTGTTNSWVYDIDDPSAPVLLGEIPNAHANYTHVHANSDIVVTHFGPAAQIATWPLPCPGTIAVPETAPRASTLGLTAAPNPFNPRTTLHFTVPTEGPVTLKLFDLRGRRVRNLMDRPVIPGEHTVVWDGRDNAGRIAPAGVYLALLRAAGRSVTTRLTLVR